MNTVQRNWPILFFSALAFLFFWQYFLLDQVLYGGDSVFIMVPFRQYVHSYLSSGELPLWNPYLLGGTPALAESQYQVFYLPNAIFFLLGVPRGMAWLLPLHLVFMAAGTYLFCRHALSLGRAASVFAAVAFSFSGFIQSRLGTWVYAEAIAWMPWMLWFYNHALSGRRLAWAGVCVALALQICAGGPQFSYYCLILCLCWHCYRWLEARAGKSDAVEQGAGKTESSGKTESYRIGRRFLLLPLIVFLGAGLCAGQILPQMELARSSARGLNATYEYATQFSLAPGHFVTTSVLPGYYGLFSEAPREGFVPAEESSYIGLLTLVLIGAALVIGRPRRLVVFWVLIVLLSLIIAFGLHNPLYPLMYRYVPGIAVFRGPARCLVLTSFAGAMLGAIGLQAILNRFQKPSVAGALRLRTALAAAAILVLSADLFWLSRSMEMQHTLSVAAIEAPSQTAKFLHQQVDRKDDFSERFWSSDTQLPMEQWQVPNMLPGVGAQEFRGISARLMRDTMLSCMPAEFRAHGLTGAWGGLMPLQRHALPLYEPDITPESQLHWLRLLNVRHQLYVQPQPESKFRFEVGGPPFIYRDDEALPRAFWIGNAQRVPTKDALAATSAVSFDPRRSVILETTEPATPGETPPANAQRANESVFKPATIAHYVPQQVTIDVEAPRAGHVVLMDTFQPGWRATVDGKESKLEPANWMGRAVPVPEGRHQVKMWFEPRSVQFGVFVSLLSLMFLAAIIAAQIEIRKPASKAKSPEAAPVNSES